MSSSSACDCVIVGGGPAGSALAARLLAFGRTVALIDDGRKRHAIAEETLVPGAARLIELCGFAAVFAEHRFFGVRRQDVLWGSDESEALDVVDEAARGFKVERHAFDHALRQHAGRLGARLFDSHRVRRRLPEEGRGSVEIEGSDGAVSKIEARSIAIAAGRGQHRSLIDSEVELEGAATKTLAFLVETATPMTDRTMVEAIAEGWLWWIPTRGESCCVAAFVDNDELKELGTTPLLTRAFDGALGARLANELAPPSFGADGTPRLLRSHTPVFLCGDAASAVDALSSQGLEKALASANDTARAIHTALDHPELRTPLLEHRHAWERRLWRAHLREATRWYLREQRFADRPLWRARHRPDLLRESLAPSTVLQRNDALVSRPTVRRSGNGYEAATGIGVGGSDHGLAEVGRVPIHALLDLIESPRTVADALARAAQVAALYPLRPQQIVEALGLLVDEQMLHASAGDA